ncbi:hypothetical protein CK203_079741 [Vitis vinifera]|uniref:RING-type domain-containing protein n=1 Tax=Vitis vinifera TaxID=29760 RepID=A0A438ECT1_VITVI|nr:hypothetical protein CK203_079741 [Vitis vinifera]
MRSGAKWLKWIEWCISIVLFFVLVNGTPLGFFQISRGLRQANPLSPYLFILAMKTLSCILFKAKEGRFIDGFLVKGRDNVGMKIFHLLFVDDTLILYNSCKKKLEHLNLVFMWFAAILRLKINLEKSELVPVGEVPNMEGFAKVLSCKVGALPTTYLAKDNVDHLAKERASHLEEFSHLGFLHVQLPPGKELQYGRVSAAELVQAVHEMLCSAGINMDVEKQSLLQTTLTLQEQLKESQAALLLEQEKADMAAKEADTAKASWMCRVCLSAEVDITIIPCGHVLCRRCSSAVSRCPFCRLQVSKTMKIYRP